MSNRLLVTGANGHLGRRIVKILLQKQAGKVIAATRDPAKAADLAAQGAEIRSADFSKPETLKAAFAGVDRLLLISTDAVFVSGQRLGQHRAAVAAAQAAGVRHMLYTSVVSPFPSDSIIENDHFWTEQAIMASTMSWTFLRHALYTDNLLGALPTALASGTWSTATDNKGRHSVTREDCAQADAAALAADDAANRIYDITGPAPVTAEDVANIAAELTGKPLRHNAITAEQLAGGLKAAGLPPTLIGALVGFDVATARGYHATTTPAVRELTGHEPMTVREFLTANKAALLPQG